MFGPLLSPRRGAAPSPLAAAPPGSRIYAVGDIHGRPDLLVALQRRIAADAGDFGGRKLLVYLGDYIDRGADSRAVLDLLLDQPLPGFETVPLCGNHEQTLLLFLHDLSMGEHWLAYGGVETLLSYDIRVPPGDYMDRNLLRRLQTELRDHLPARHLSFLRQLKYRHAEGDYLFVHAGVRPGVALARQDDQDLLWIREPFLSSSANFGKLVVHGHTITEQVEFRANRIGIDTGAYYSDRLSCLVLEADRRRVIAT